jgi:hypothetical protein
LKSSGGKGFESARKVFGDHVADRPGLTSDRQAQWSGAKFDWHFGNYPSSHSGCGSEFAEITSGDGSHLSPVVEVRSKIVLQKM